MCIPPNYYTTVKAHFACNTESSLLDHNDYSIPDLNLFVSRSLEVYSESKMLVLNSKQLPGALNEHKTVCCLNFKQMQHHGFWVQTKVSNVFMPFAFCSKKEPTAVVGHVI